MKPFRTPFAEITLWDNGINKAVAVPELLTKKQMKAHFIQVTEKLGDFQFGLVDVRGVKKVTKEFRQYCATEEAAAYTRAVALLVSSGFSKIAGNIYLNFNKPKNPTKLFTDENKAEKWFLEQMERIIKEEGRER